MNDKKEVLDTIKAAETYLEHLKTLQTDLCTAEEQIRSTSQETKHNIEVILDNIGHNLKKILNERKEVLLKRVHIVSFIFFVLYSWALKRNSKFISVRRRKFSSLNRIQFGYYQKNK